VQEMDLSGTSFLRQFEGMLQGKVRPRGTDEVRRRSGGFAKVEYSLVNGLLPDPSPEAAETGWMDTYHWDFAVYANTNPRIGYTDLFYSTHMAAIALCGLFDDLPRGLPGVTAIKRKRVGDLIPVLESCRILRCVEGPFQNEYGNLSWKQLLLAPTWPATVTAPITTFAGKTNENLDAFHRSWFMLPSALFNDELGTWRKVGSHRGRRVIAALYCFYEADTYGAVNPNHLRLKDQMLQVSDAFLKACGRDATVRDVASTLTWLWNKKRVFPVAARLEAGTPYAAGTEYVTWTQTVARDVPSGMAVFVPLYIPGEADKS